MYCVVTRNEKAVFDFQQRKEVEKLFEYYKLLKLEKEATIAVVTTCSFM